jgi:hypothetical protein
VERDDRIVELAMIESLSDIFSKLPWLKNYRVPGYPDYVISVRFRLPPFIIEDVLVRIDSVECRLFLCTVICQPEKPWRINKGDKILVEYYYFEHEYRLICPTIEEKFDFKWL